MSKESFKGFVRQNPRLVQYVNQNQMTWQKFYEMYDMYGAEHEVWQPYLSSETVSPTGNDASKTGNSFLGDTSLKELFNMVKNVDLETVRKGVDGLQKAISLVQDLGSHNASKTSASSYQARPMYKYFED